MKANGGKRLTILLIILGGSIIVFGIVFFLYGPYSEAAKGGTKGKPTPTATSPTPKPSASTTVTISSPPESPSGSALFSDDFSGTLSKWEVVYKFANIVSGQLQLKPEYTNYDSPSDTHAPLAVAGDSAWKDYVFSVKMKTVKQLRPTNPNPWEVGWLIFRYVDVQHFYYFVHKPNGIELGRVDPSGTGGQIFLYTAENPKLTLGQYNDYKVTLKGNNIRISINGTQVVNYTDSSNPLLSGRIGLYNEDSETLSDNVTVVAN